MAKQGVVGERTNVDDVFVKNCWSSVCSCWLRSISLLLIVDDGGGVGGVDSNIICWDVEIEFDDDSGGEDEGDGGCGSTSVHRAWLTRRDEHEYGWSSSIDDDGGYLPPVGNEIDKLRVDFDCWWCANDIVWSLTVKYEWRRDESLDNGRDERRHNTGLKLKFKKKQKSKVRILE